MTDVDNEEKIASYEAYLEMCANLDKSKWDFSYKDGHFCYDCGSGLTRDSIEE